MLTLFVARDTCSLASHICLEEAAATYQIVRVDFTRGEQRSSQYLQVNPKGRVPALSTPSGVLTETPALLVYIAQTYAHAALAPLQDAFEFARVQAFNSYLCSTVHVAHAHGRRGYRWADDSDAIEAMRRKVAVNMADCFALIENQMFTGPWVMGERYTICDPYLFTMARWLESDGVLLSRFPVISAHHERMLARPAVQKALTEERAT